MALLRLFVFRSHCGVEHRLQLRDAVAVFAAGQHHLLTAVGAADVFKVLLRFCKLALFQLVRLGQRHHIGNAVVVQVAQHL